MELFDPNGDQPWRNVLWIIVLGIAGVYLTVNYFDSVKRENLESKYVHTTAYLTNAEEWVRVSKKNGRETGRKNYYKFSYKYNVGTQTYSGDGRQDDSPGNTFSVYYDSRNPSTHVLERHKSDGSLAAMLVGGLLILGFIVANIYLYKSKRRKLGVCGGGTGAFKPI